jgi:hypothetical protein
MTRRTAGLLVGASIVLVLVLALWWLLGRDGAGDGTGDGDDTPRDPTLVVLYFPADDGYLYPEDRSLPVGGTPRERTEALVAALLEGPETLGLSRPYPEEVAVLGAYTTPNGVAYVDLGAEGQDNPPPGGSLEEMMMVYSVVNTVIENVPEVRRVALTWNSRQRESFTGHLDLSRPLGAKRDLVGTARGPESRTAPAEEAP